MQKIICIIVHTMKKTGHFVNGEVIHEDGKNIEIFNPSNGEIISSINCASKNIIEKTIISSQNAFNEWKLYSIAKKN